MKKSRQPVYDALSLITDAEWIVYITQIRALNSFLGNCVMDDPTPNQALEIAIEEALKL